MNSKVTPLEGGFVGTRGTEGKADCIVLYSFRAWRALIWWVVSTLQLRIWKISLEEYRLSKRLWISSETRVCCRSLNAGKPGTYLVLFSFRKPRMLWVRERLGIKRDPHFATDSGTHHKSRSWKPQPPVGDCFRRGSLRQWGWRVLWTAAEVLVADPQEIKTRARKPAVIPTNQRFWKWSVVPLSVTYSAPAGCPGHAALPQRLAVV